MGRRWLTILLIGDSTNVESRQTGPNKGPQGDWHKENISAQQSEVCGTSTKLRLMTLLIFVQPVWPSKFYEQQYNNPKGK